MPALTIYSKEKSARLSYVLDWLFKERLGIDYTLVHQAPSTDSLFISYGSHASNGITVPDAGLLWQSEICSQSIETGKWKELPTLYPTSDNYDISFDIFSAIFFLLSRYEEYYDYKADKHNRYPATESILFKNGLLKRPIVDEWITVFSAVLSSKNILVNKQSFEYLPTYDIDIAWSYKNKGVKRTLGAFAKDTLKGNVDSIQNRAKTLSGSQKDPYDSFEWLDNLHRKNKLAPIYFILCAKRTSAFDKNIPADDDAMQTLIKTLSKKYSIGIHPSYTADVNEDILPNEKGILEGVIGKTTTISRQHYIKNRIPNCYRTLLQNNIADDYSMGYGTHIGFRAGTGSSFWWYDLEQEKTETLRIHPFCFMDTTAHFEERLSMDEAFQELRNMKTVLAKTNSKMITVFHNFSLGTDKEWNGWSQAYESFISECIL